MNKFTHIFLSSIFFLSLVLFPFYAHSQKITDLPALISPTADDLLLAIDDPLGSAITKKISIQNLLKILKNGGYEIVTDNLITTGITQTGDLVTTGITQTGDLVTKSPWVDVRSFMDGQSGRPTYATWVANQTTTDVTAVLQAWINYAISIAQGTQGVGSTLKLGPNSIYRIISSLTFPTGFTGNTIDLNGSKIFYDGSVDATAAIFKITNNQFHYNKIINGMFDANSKAGFCIYAVGAGNLYAIKKTKVEDVVIENATVALVQIGNYTTSGNDQDASNWQFNRVSSYAINGSVGYITDAPNAFNIGWSNCEFHNVGGQIPSNHIKNINGSGYYIFNAYFGTVSDYCIYHKNGNLTLVGFNTEEGSILKTETMVNERKSIFIANGMVNESTASSTPEYAIYAPVGQLNVHNCTLGKDNIFPRKIYAGDVLIADNIYLGSNSTGTILGSYELDYPERCVIEGQALSAVKILNANPTMQLWAGSASEDYPLGYRNSGNGVSTVIRSTSYNVQGPYTAHINITVGADSAAYTSDGLQTIIPIANSLHTGTRSLLVVVRGRTANLSVATITLEIAFYNAAGNLRGGNNIAITPAGDNTFEGFGGAYPNDEDATYAKITIGMGTAAATGDIYVDNFYVLQMENYIVNGGYHALTIAKALTDHIKPIEGNLEYFKAGIVACGPPSALNKMFWASAAPSQGDYRQGDIIWNSGATTGQPSGWMCISGGTPGTWLPMPNL